ncbi:MAG: carboxypeptidase-like regulatory domain-containing protein [Bacteroidia bacterium]|nr:carboxypeptidase-like regulatory domain-containing protein [Bacteroidia bacterium]
MDLKSYIKGNRHGKTANKLEKKAMNDPFLQDAIDGFDAVPGDHFSTMEKLEKQLAPQPGRIGRRVWMWAAAAVLVLLIGIPLLLRQPDLKDIQVASSETAKQEETSVLSPEKDSVLVADHTLPKQDDEKTATTAPKEISVQEMETPPPSAAEEMAEIVSRETTRPQQPERAATTIEPEQIAAARAAQPQKQAFQGRAAGVTTASNTTTVSGKIVDETGEPLIGVTINMKDTQLGAVTDIDGKFHLTVPKEEEGVLIASYVGMENVEIPLKENVGDVMMKSDDLALEEIVVVAFGTQKRESVIGSVSKAKDTNTAFPTFGETEFIPYFLENYDKTICADEPVAIKVEFYVNVQGRPGNIVIKENSCPELETEIKRLLLGSPKWSQTNRKVTLNLTLNE